MCVIYNSSLEKVIHGSVGMCVRVECIKPQLSDCFLFCIRCNTQLISELAVQGIVEFVTTEYEVPYTGQGQRFALAFQTSFSTHTTYSL